MAKKSFGAALGAVFVALAGHGAGCSSTLAPANADADGSEGRAAPREAGSAGGEDADDDGYGSGDDCSLAPAPTKADLDQADGAPGWNPPKPRQTTACSAADLSRFSDNLNNQNLQTWDDVVTGLPTSCAQCILSRETDANWQLVVADASGKNGFVNWGACYADAPHGSAACGLADQYLHFCILVSCNGCASTDACTTSKVVLDTCDGAFGPMLQASCPQAFAQELDEQCGTIVAAAAIVCGDGVLPDGGKLTD